MAVHKAARRVKIFPDRPFQEALPYWKYWKKTERLTKLPIKLPEKVRQFVIKLPEVRQLMIIPPENESTKRLMKL